MASNFGELVLVVGDHFIPTRSHSIPPQFTRMLLPGKMQHVICTGNLGGYYYESEEYQRLKELVGGGSANVHCVAGEYDFLSSFPVASVANASSGTTAAIMSPSFPETKVIQLGQFRVGIIGGHQVVPHGELHALSMTRRKLNVDILVCGWKRQEGVVEFDGGYYIFPGSITGAYSASEPNSRPSFILLAVQNDKIVCYVYKLKENAEVDVSKTEFSKKHYIGI
ncbi:hypothetical protein ACHAWU_000499 [Discostella pseudostelligera]|uniref:Vacuolar protein sorting-associated protein 29 n=1 Tax=Discostella pseudostelligera TaxID=259834 RepID=A0ABD3MB83_9STRA